MSDKAGNLRSMGIPSHITNDVGRKFSPTGDVISVANTPEMCWMVTTSKIDSRTATPSNAVASHSHLHQSSELPHGQIPPTINQFEYPQTKQSSSSLDQKQRLTKSGKPRGTPGRKRKIEDHDLPPEEAAKRGLRRERNKVAAAKCRNRRRELMERLQGETDVLEDDQGVLTQEIIALQQEKEHLEFVLASHVPACKVLHEKSLNVMNNQSRNEMRYSDSNERIGADLVSPINIDGGVGRMTTSERLRGKLTTVSVIQAGPSLINSTNSMAMSENIFPAEVNSVIVGRDTIIQGSYSLQEEEFDNAAQEEEHRFPATLANFDELDQVVAEEPLNTPVCTLSTPSNTTSIFTFPNTLCVTSNSMASNSMSFPDTYSYSSAESVMSAGNFLHPGQFATNAAIETCSQAHRKSSSSESHHSPDSVRSPHLLSL